MANPLTALSLCSGVGGLELGLRLALGARCLRVLAYVERDPYAASVLLARMEDATLEPAPIFCGDLADLDGRPFTGVDLVCAGLPCQPFSLAGKRIGLSDKRAYGAGDGPIPHTLRIIGECRPALVFFENVPAWVTGGYFRRVGEELCRLGYEIEEPFFCRASDVGTPHRRERVFILAHARRRGDHAEQPESERGSSDAASPGEGRSAVAHAECAERDDGQGQAPSGPGERGATVADTPSPRRDDTREYGGGSPSLPARSQQRSAAVADAENVDGRVGKSGTEDIAGLRRGRLAGAGGMVGDTEGDGRNQAECWQAHDLGPFPPGPGDAEGWRRMLAVRPDLAPALPRLRRVADGLARRLVVHGVSRVDRLRVLGNGCVPAQAAAAFLELIGRVRP